MEMLYELSGSFWVCIAYVEISSINLGQSWSEKKGYARMTFGDKDELRYLSL